MPTGKRANQCVTFDELCTILVGLGLRKPPKLRRDSAINPQSKEEYTRVKDSKEEKTKEDDSSVDFLEKKNSLLGTTISK